MKRISNVLIAAFAALGLALGGAAFAQKEAPKPADAKKAPPSTEIMKTEAPTKSTGQKAVEPMDINTASEKDLAKLKGIGDVRAKAIVKGRPYKGKDDLLTKKIVPQNVYDDIKDQIVARQKNRSPG